MMIIESRTVGRLERDALSILLFAAVLSPVMAAALRWPLYPPSAVAITASFSAMLVLACLALLPQVLVPRDAPRHSRGAAGPVAAHYDSREVSGDR